MQELINALQTVQRIAEAAELTATQTPERTTRLLQIETIRTVMALVNRATSIARQTTDPTRDTAAQPATTFKR